MAFCMGKTQTGCREGEKYTEKSSPRNNPLAQQVSTSLADCKLMKVIKSAATRKKLEIGEKKNLHN